MRWLFYIGLAVGVWWFFFRRPPGETQSRAATIAANARRFKILPGGLGTMPTMLEGGKGPRALPDPNPGTIA